MDDRWGFGMASVRFICGTQDLHQGTRGAACLKVPGHRRTRSSTPVASTPTAAFSRSIFGEEDAVISDALNHASIIDGIRLSKAPRFRYANQRSSRTWRRSWWRRKDPPGGSLIVTDGVFSMDGYLAPLREPSATSPRSTTPW
jgi:glycine C-acetyltransferase